MMMKMMMVLCLAMGSLLRRINSVGVRIIKMKEDNGIISRMLNITLDKWQETAKTSLNLYRYIDQISYNQKACIKTQ